jgi:hypothetical protein
MDVQAANTIDLVEAFLRHGKTSGAVRILREMSEGRIASLEDFYLPGDQRIIEGLGRVPLRPFIKLLDFYMAAEIAFMISFISRDHEQDVWAESLRFLSNSAFRDLYERAYPLTLPRLLRRRLSGEFLLTETRTEGVSAIFISFLSLINRSNEQNDMWDFVEYLLTGETRFVQGEEIVSTIRNKEEFLDGILRPPQVRSRLDWVLLGCSQFFTFCDDFDRLLQSSQYHRLLQSAMWFYYEDFFGRCALRLRAGIEHTLSQFSFWTQGEEWQRIRQDFNAITVQLMSPPVFRLTSGEYGSFLTDSLGVASANKPAQVAERTEQA